MAVSQKASRADWPLVPLVDMAEVNPESLSAGTAADFRFKYIDLSSVERGEINWSSVQELTFAGAPSRARRLVRPGDVLFGTVRPVLQSHGAIPAMWADGTIVASTGFSVIRARRTTADRRFLFHFILSDAVTSEARRVEVGSNYPAVNEADVRQFQLPKPPLPEQHRIAEILDIVDEAIMGTERLIAKLQQLKQGLLNDLLTRGIDDSGELRDPERHPEQFNDSPLGAVPAKWRVATLADVVRDTGGLIQTGPFGSQLHAHEYVMDGVPVVMPKDIDGDHFNEARISRITERRATDLVRYRLRRNDAVFARRGDLSRCAPVSANEEGWLCGTGCLLVRIPHGGLLGEWLAAVYRHDIGQRQVAARAVGSTMVNLNTSILSRLTVPIPPAPEQRESVRRLNELKNRMHSELDLLRKLHAVKSGLSDDLLTGRVRVTEHVDGDAA
jgi:type I restriction enzyme, S subunit